MVVKKPLIGTLRQIVYAHPNRVHSATKLWDSECSAPVSKQRTLTVLASCAVTVGSWEFQRPARLCSMAQIHRVPFWIHVV